MGTAHGGRHTKDRQTKERWVQGTRRKRNIKTDKPKKIWVQGYQQEYTHINRKIKKNIQKMGTGRTHKAI